MCTHVQSAGCCLPPHRPDSGHFGARPEHSAHWAAQGLPKLRPRSRGVEGGVGASDPGVVRPVALPAGGVGRWCGGKVGSQLLDKVHTAAAPCYCQLPCRGLGRPCCPARQRQLRTRMHSAGKQLHQTNCAHITARIRGHAAPISTQPVPAHPTCSQWAAWPPLQAAPPGHPALPACGTLEMPGPSAWRAGQ